MNAKKSLIKRIFNILLSVILIILIVVIALAVFVRISGNTPSFGGYMIFRVSSGSMEPELKIGDVILTKEVSDISSVKKGDIVTYHGTSGNFAGKLITHQVVKAPYEVDGTYYIVTKGIANLTEDTPVAEDEIVGTMVCKVPFLGEIYNFFLTPWGLIAAILLIILAFSGEFWNIYKLSNEKEDLPEVSDEIMQKAIESYKTEKEDVISEDTDTEDSKPEKTKAEETYTDETQATEIKTEESTVAEEKDMEAANTEETELN